MENQHKLIKGYRDLSQAEINSMNHVKDAANTVGYIIETLEELPGIDKRWLAIAKTDLQKGFMCLTRSIAKPESF